MAKELLLSFSIAAIFLGGELHAAAAPSIEGRWEGVIQIRPAEWEVDFTVDLRRVAGGLLGGEVSFVAQDATQPLESVSLAEGRIDFVTRDAAGVVSSFSGKLSEKADAVEGELLEGGEKYRFHLRRANDVGAVPPPLALNGSAAELRQRFNADSDDVRLLLILSPTCPMCKSAARLVQRYVLDAVADPGLRTYIVWEGVSSGDTPAAAAAAAGLVRDPRVTQFWAPQRSAGEAFREALGLRSEPAWDVFLVFAKGKRWDATVPVPDFLMSNMKTQEQIPSHPRLNGSQLVERVRSLLPPPGTVAAVDPKPCH